MGRPSDTPSWFWPVFVAGTALAMASIVGASVAGVWLVSARMRESLEAPASCPVPQAYVPPTRTFAPPPAPPPAPLGAIAEPYEGELTIEVVAHEVRGPAGVAEGDRCTLALTFRGAPSGEGECWGTLPCEGRDRPLWSAGVDQAFACTVRAEAGALVATDRPDDGRPSLSTTLLDGVTSLTVVGGTRRGRFVVFAESD